MNVGEWETLAHQLANEREPERKLTEHISKNQIYRTYADEASGDVWHGTNAGFSDGIYTELFKDGKKVFHRRWDRDGRLASVAQIVGAENGYAVRFHHGNLWQFSHYRNGKKEGVSCVFYRQEPSQAKEEEIRFKDGRISERQFGHNGFCYGERP